MQSSIKFGKGPIVNGIRTNAEIQRERVITILISEQNNLVETVKSSIGITLKRHHGCQGKIIEFSLPGIFGKVNGWAIKISPLLYIF